MLDFIGWLFINMVVAAEATFIGFMAAFVWVVNKDKIKRKFKKGE